MSSTSIKNLLNENAVIEYLKWMGYKFPENRIDNILEEGILCENKNKALCKCGVFINPSNYHLNKETVCLVCLNTKWKITLNDNSNFKKLNDYKEIYRNKNNEIELKTITKKYKIDWINQELEFKQTESYYVFDFTYRSFMRIKNKNTLKEKRELLSLNSASKLLNSWKDKELIKQVFNLYNFISDKETKLNNYFDYTNAHYIYFENLLIYMKFPNLMRVTETFNHSFIHEFVSDIEEDSKLINVKGKNAREILGLPKSIIKELKNKRLRTNELTLIKNHINEYGVDITRMILNKFERNYNFNYLEKFSSLLSSNLKVKSVLSYLDRVVETQGINNLDEALMYYSDYVRMSNEIGVDFEMNPKSLKLVHDVRSKDYKVILNEKQREYFKKRYENSNLEYKILLEDIEYEIIIPKEPEEVIQEGQELGHCVASYVTKVVNGECLILFLRQSEFKEKSYITLELNNYNCLIQARGKSNRTLNKKEKEILKSWSKNKKIELLI